MVRIGEFLGHEWNAAKINLADMKSSHEKQRRDFMTLKYESHGRKGFTGGVYGKPGKWMSIFIRKMIIFGQLLVRLQTLWGMKNITNIRFQIIFSPLE
jgi:hypothetical protein